MQDQGITIASLLELDGTGGPGRVDALVDAYLAAAGSGDTVIARNALAEEFLAAAPFTAVSYRIWRRILRDDTDLPELPVRVPSELLLPPIEFMRRRAG